MIISSEYKPFMGLYTLGLVLFFISSFVGTFYSRYLSSVLLLTISLLAVPA